MSMVVVRPELELPRRGTGSASEGAHEFVRAASVVVGPYDTCDWQLTGTADDVRLNAALAYVGVVGGGLVHVMALPTGWTYYDVTAVLVVYASTILEGEGAFTIFRPANNSNIDVIQNQTAGSDTNIVLRDFKILGNEANMASGHGVILDGTFDCLCENLDVEDVEENGIRIWETSGTHGDRNMVHTCRIKNAEVGVGIYHNDHVTVSNCTITTCIRSTGIAIRFNSGSDYGCLIIGNHLRQNDVGIHNTSVELLICNNVIGDETTSSPLDGLRIYGDQVFIIANTIFGIDNHGIRVFSGTERVLISTNYIADCGEATANTYDAILYEGDKGIIINNEILNASASFDMRNGINLIGADYCLVSNNWIEDMRTDAIRLEDSDYAFIDSNYCWGSDGVDINITNAGCASTLVGKNMLLSTTNIVDSGTGTMLPNREWLATFGDGGIALTGDVPLAPITNGQDAAVGFQCPPDLQQLVRATLKILPNATQANADWDIFSDYGTVGEAPNAHSEADAATTYNVTNNQWYDIELVALGFFASMTIGDRGGIRIRVSTAGHNLSLFSLVFEYV